MKFSKIHLFLVCGLLLTFACRTKDYYRHRMVRKAREFLLEERRDLTEIQRDYIRYATPEILHSQLMERIRKKANSPLNIAQTCVAWKVPGMDKLLVVSGVSEQSLEYWYPNRVVEKNYVKPKTKKLRAIHRARIYVMNRMLFLSDEIRNRIRFTNPEIIESKFDIDVPETHMEKLKNPTQISFLWPGENPNQSVIVMGIGNRNMKRWKPDNASLKSSDEIEKFKIKTIEKPEKAELPKTDDENPKSDETLECTDNLENP